MPTNDEGNRALFKYLRTGSTCTRPTAAAAPDWVYNNTFQTPPREGEGNGLSIEGAYGGLRYVPRTVRGNVEPSLARREERNTIPCVYDDPQW
jgi:hypothetical protein